MVTKAAPVGASRPRLSGDILWLGITALVFAVIVSMMSWPLSTELSIRAHAGGASAGPTIGIAPEAGAGSATAPLSPTFGINRILTQGASLTTADEATEGSSSAASTISIVAPTELAGVNSLLKDSAADRLPNQPFADNGGLTPAPNRPQPAQSVLATPAAHSSGPSRPRQSHQRTRPLAPRANGELAPW